jgi:hypothetical protein
VEVQKLEAGFLEHPGRDLVGDFALISVRANLG